MRTADFRKFKIDFLPLGTLAEEEELMNLEVEEEEEEEAVDPPHRGQSAKGTPGNCSLRVCVLCVLLANMFRLRLHLL